MLEMADMEAGHAHRQAGQIEFACNVPGHYEAGMKGVAAIL
jgi:uncharacterized cupredoxin-like copper-binding protein